MHNLFLICSVAGGAILLCQLALTLAGLTDHADLPDDAPGDSSHGVDLSDSQDGADHDSAGDHAGHFVSVWLLGALSFRTITAALAFFGLAGLAAEGVEWSA